jgi:hypothetical protein
MSEVQQNTVEKQTPPAADKQPKVRATKPRQVDSGPQTLPTMEHFVQLVRKVQCPELLRLSARVQYSSGVRAERILRECSQS